ncbi:MAG: aminoglycoside phosphotransferase family protein [Chloroflexota bacterium]
MNRTDVLSGQTGLAEVQWALNGQSSRRILRKELQAMLQPGHRPGALRLTRAKFKPERKLLAYFTCPVLDEAEKATHSVHLAVAWQKTLNDTNHVDTWARLQEAADRSGLMPVQKELWRQPPDQGIRLQLWPFDPEFPQLVRLGNPAYIADRFASLGIPHDRKRLPLVVPIRYRPGERHVLRYEFSSPTMLSPQRLYAKLYSNGEAAAKAYGVANRVVDWLAANNRGLQGNRPAALSHEDGVIFYSHAPGIPLSRQLKRSRRWLGDQMRIIGSALAVLHNGPEGLQSDLKQNNFTNEVKVVKRASEHIQVLLPETYDKILEILDQAQEYYSSLPQEKPTFTHADFKADHLLSTPFGLTLIDFDTCTLTDPSLDVGKFLADLDWWFALQGISAVEEAQAEMLKGYQGAGVPDPIIHERLARARIFHVLILVKIVVRRVPIYQKQWATMTGQMIRRAAELLQKIKSVA